LRTETERLSRLIENVLEFARLEKQPRLLHLQEGTLEDVVEAVQQIMGERLRQAGFSLQIDLEPLPPFPYDREALTQALVNILDNSLKFGNASPVKQIILRAWREARQIKISVADSGPGIPRKAIKKVFEDFYRADTDLTRHTPGTGLGLALVKKYVTAIGGTVTAANQDGPGCTITISLPTERKK
jgi:two-component system, OmpR family, sensor histidine kinase VicK